MQLLSVNIFWKCFTVALKSHSHFVPKFVTKLFRYLTCLDTWCLNAWKKIESGRGQDFQQYWFVLSCVGGLISAVCGGLSWSRLLAEEVWGRTSSREHEEAASVSVWEAGGVGLCDQKHRYPILMYELWSIMPMFLNLFPFKSLPWWP